MVWLEYLNAMTEYIFGDSHVSFFSGKDELLPEGEWVTIEDKILCRMGPHTAYGLIGKDEVLEEIKKIPKGSRLTLSFGEIDCRAHLGKHKNVAEAVDRYFQFIEKLKDDYKITLLLPPPSHPDEIHSVGTPLERNLITQEFNHLCKAMAQELGIDYFSLFDKLVNEKMETKTEYYFDTCHLKQIAHDLR